MKQPPRLILLTTPFMRDPDLSRTCAGISQSRRENTLRSTGLPFSGLPFGSLAFSGLAFAGLPFCTTVVFELGSFNRSCRRVANTLGSCGNASFVGLQRLKRLSQSIQRKGPRKRTRRMTCSMKPRRRDLRTLSLPQKGHTKVAVWFCVPIESCCRKFTQYRASCGTRLRGTRGGETNEWATTMPLACRRLQKIWPIGSPFLTGPNPSGKLRRLRGASSRVAGALNLTRREKWQQPSNVLRHDETSRRQQLQDENDQLEETRLRNQSRRSSGSRLDCEN